MKRRGFFGSLLALFGLSRPASATPGRAGGPATTGPPHPYIPEGVPCRVILRRPATAAELKLFGLPPGTTALYELRVYSTGIPARLADGLPGTLDKGSVWVNNTTVECVWVTTPDELGRYMERLPGSVLGPVG